MRRAVALLAALPSLALAAPVTVTQDASIALGDGGDRAKALCVVEAQRLAVAGAGSLVEATMTSSTREAAAGTSSSDAREVKSFSAAVVGSEVISAAPAGDRMGCTVKVTYDPEEIRAKLNDLAGADSLKKKLADQQAQISALSANLQAVATRPAPAPEVVYQPMPVYAPAPAAPAPQPAPQAVTPRPAAAQAQPVSQPKTMSPDYAALAKNNPRYPKPVTDPSSPDYVPGAPYLNR